MKEVGAMGHLQASSREDPKVAKEVIESLIPIRLEREAILRQLISSIDFASAIASDSAAVTLFTDGFRLNVGAVMALSCFDELIMLGLHGSMPASLQQSAHLRPSSFSSVPQPQYFFCGRISDLITWKDTIREAHEAYLRAAAVTETGKPRRAVYAKSHSPGLVAYAEDATRKNPVRSRYEQ